MGYDAAGGPKEACDMNRQQRRKALKENRKAAADHAPTVAIHEAGHAVARYLTAGAMGFETEEAIA